MTTVHNFNSDNFGQIQNSPRVKTAMVRIVIFEDNVQLSEGLSLFLNTVEGYEVVGLFRTLSGIEKEIKHLKPDVVLMDIGFPSGSGIEATRAIKKINKEIIIIMLTGLSDEHTVFEALRAGADGYLLKKTPPTKLLEYISEALEGGAPMTPSVARMVLATFSTPANQSSEGESLTNREKDVLKLLVNGHSYKLVSSELNISIDTVRSHVRNIYEKLQVNSKSEAVAKAIINKIV